MHGDKSSSFPEFYFETHFTIDGEAQQLPASYSIITAFATTWEKWTDEENMKANSQLLVDLENAKVDKWPITGYSPTTGYAEPGWATTLSSEEVCRLGRHFRQLAVYLVDEGVLSVMLCDGGEQRTVGPMSEHLQSC